MESGALRAGPHAKAARRRRFAVQGFVRGDLPLIAGIPSRALADLGIRPLLRADSSPVAAVGCHFPEPTESSRVEDSLVVSGLREPDWTGARPR